LNLIPNELADVAVDLAPFVAMIPGGAPFAAAMRGIGRFDQRGSISDALKQAAGTYAFSKVATPFTNQLPGLAGNTYEGLSGVMQAGKDLGSSAYSGIKSLGTGGKNAEKKVWICTQQTMDLKQVVMVAVELEV
jgi:hypothetical protein